ncbi:MAG: gluconokinase [Actinobacteria bacterium]|nr:gluconokinase [Actinomycetota bacterium]
MGPSGAGKSVVGARLAAELGVPFLDADDLHPAANVAKMAAGEPLGDEDRMPWLDVVASRLRDAPEGVVIACSALARRYRDRLRAGAGEVTFVELMIDRAELDRRMHLRTHFMPPSLLDSQLATLEHLADDEPGFVFVNDGDIGRVTSAISERLRGR